MKYRCPRCKTIAYQAFQKPSDLTTKCPNCGNASTMVTRYDSNRDTLEAANRVLPELLAVLSEHPLDVQQASLYLLETAMHNGRKIVVRVGKPLGSGSVTCSVCSKDVDSQDGIIRFSIWDPWRKTSQEMYFCGVCKHKALWEQELDLHESNGKIQMGLA